MKFTREGWIVLKLVVEGIRGGVCGSILLPIGLKNFTKVIIPKGIPHFELANN